jgi:hypothetical protein
VKGNGLPGPDQAGLSILPKAKLIAMILAQREDMRLRLEEKDQQITELSEQLAKLQGEIDKEKAGQKVRDINEHVNQPTSKKPEWDKDGNPKPATKGQKKRRKKRTGCGNPRKSGLTPDETHFSPLASCPGCGNDLGGRKGKADSGRIVEDISLRAFTDTFPQYRSLMKFYLKLRRTIRDGEKLQAARDGLSERVFQRRLKAL